MIRCVKKISVKIENLYLTTATKGQNAKGKEQFCFVTSKMKKFYEILPLLSLAICPLQICQLAFSPLYIAIGTSINNNSASESAAMAIWSVSQMPRASRVFNAWPAMVTSPFSTNAYTPLPGFLMR